jgi:hypothetical protein
MRRAAAGFAACLFEVWHRARANNTAGPARCRRRPAIGQNSGGVADQPGRTEPHGIKRLGDRRDARPDQRTAVAAHDLEIHMIVPRIDRGYHRLLAVPAHDGCGVGRQRGHADHRLAGGQPDAARGGESNPQPSKAAGAGGHRDPVECGEGEAGFLDDAGDQRHQGFGVAALHRLRFLRDHPVGVGVEHGRGAGIQRGIDGEDQHGLIVPLFKSSWPGLSRPSTRLLRPKNVDGPGHRRAEATPSFGRLCPGMTEMLSRFTAQNHIGRTSTTSGTKCFSRFWMPCCSVAVDDGQPAQEPFMLR